MSKPQWIHRLRPAALILLPAALAAFSSLPLMRLVPLNSEEHSLAADRGAGAITVPESVTLPPGIVFEENPGDAYAERVRRAKRLAVGFDSNEETEYSEDSGGVQDNCYWYGFGQRDYNLIMYVPIEGVLPERVLLVDGYVGPSATPFTFGELVALYADYRRTTFCDDEGRCYLSNADIESIRFDRGNVVRNKDFFCPDPVPAGDFLRMIGAGVVAPFGTLANSVSNTADEDEYDEAGWWGDEMLRIATVNDVHFSNVAVAWYVGMHRLALLYAVEASEDNRKWTKALHYEASAVHALIDLFAFGHIVTNRDESSYQIMAARDLWDAEAYVWMENVVRMGGGTRNTCGPPGEDTGIDPIPCPKGLVGLSAQLPTVSDMPTSRNDFMPSYNRFDYPEARERAWMARIEESYHTKFNASGAEVTNLLGREFDIFGDGKVHPSSAPDETLDMISQSVRESVQALFDAQVVVESGSTTVEGITSSGSEFFRALKYIPIFVREDPDRFFLGRWALYAGVVDDLTGADQVPDDWAECRIPFLNGLSDLPPAQSEWCTQPPPETVVAPEAVLDVQRDAPPAAEPVDPPEQPSTPEAQPADRAARDAEPLSEFLVYDDLIAYFTPARDTILEQFRWRIARDDSAVAVMGLWDEINDLTGTERAEPGRPGAFVADIGNLEDEGPGLYRLQTCLVEDPVLGTFGSTTGWYGCGPWRDEGGETFEVGDVRFHLQGIVIEDGVVEMKPSEDFFPPGSVVMRRSGGAGGGDEAAGARRRVGLEVEAHWVQMVARDYLKGDGPDSLTVLRRNAANLLASERARLGESNLQLIVRESTGWAYVIQPQTSLARLDLSLPEILDPNQDSIAGVISGRMQVVTPGYDTYNEDTPAQFHAVVRALAPTGQLLDRSVAFDYWDWNREVEDFDERNAREAEQFEPWGTMEGPEEPTAPGFPRSGAWFATDGAEKTFQLHKGPTHNYSYGDGTPWFSELVRDPAVRWFMPIQISQYYGSYPLYAFAVYGVQPGVYDGPAPTVPSALTPRDSTVIASNERGEDDPEDPEGEGRDPGDGPLDPATLNPDSPDVGGAIRQWIGVARPSDTVDEDVSYHYDEWGRAVGGRGGGIITGGEPPTGRAGRTPEAYVWGIRDDLDSVDHCTLGDFVVRTLSRSGTEECRGRYIPAPRIDDFTDKPVAEAAGALNARGIDVQVTMRGPADTRELAHTVISQTPAAGTRVREGRTVRLTIRGDFADLVVVPQVDGVLLTTARERLEQAGLDANRVPGPPAPSRERVDFVVSQEPGPDSEVERGATITLVVHGAFDPERGRVRECGQLVSEGMRAHTSGNYGRALQLYGEARALGCQNPRLDDANDQASGAKADQERQEREDDFQRQQEEERRRRQKEEEDRRRRDEDERRARAEEQRRRQCTTLINQGQSAYDNGRKSEALGHYQEAQRRRCQEYANADLDAFITRVIDEINQENRINRLQPRCDALVRQGRGELDSGNYDAADNTLREAMNLDCPNSGLYDLWNTASNCKLQLTVINQARGWGADTSLLEMMFGRCPGSEGQVPEGGPPVDVANARTTNFVGYYEYVDPERTYQEFHGWVRLESDGTFTSEDIITNGTDIRPGKGRWTWDQSRRHLDLDWQPGGRFQGQVSGNTHDFTFTGNFANGLAGRLHLTRRNR